MTRPARPTNLGRDGADLTRTVASLRGDITASGNYTAEAGVWADPPPTTLAEAITRLARRVRAEHGVVP